ncbi:MAG TPA: hypothetical protein VE621_21140 [Bryobacteraceae bacterium]|jgi:hypothetical protein|nr:hypothetical protein [Bryobacteraceae bacterium]
MILRSIGVIALFACMLSGEDTKAKASKSGKPPARVKAAASKPAPALVVPGDAEQVGDNLYRKTGTDGKTWYYRRTPFGVARMSPEEAGAGAALPNSKVEEQPTTAVESGDSVRFERRTPFGTNSWTRKKSELSAEERAILEKQKSGSSQQ